LIPRVGARSTKEVSGRRGGLPASMFSPHPGAGGGGGTGSMAGTPGGMGTPGMAGMKTSTPMSTNKNFVRCDLPRRARQRAAPRCAAAGQAAARVLSAFSITPCFWLGRCARGRRSDRVLAVGRYVIYYDEDDQEITRKAKVCPSPCTPPNGSDRVQDRKRPGIRARVCACLRACVHTCAFAARRARPHAESCARALGVSPAAHTLQRRGQRTLDTTSSRAALSTPRARL